METITLDNGITYSIVAEDNLSGKALEIGNYQSILILKRPKGVKKFWAMRDKQGNVTLN